MKSLRERFAAYVEVGGEDECWNWTASRKRNGYGQIKANWPSRRMLSAHRVAWELANGRSIPRGMVVMHTCDNRRCCNPSHLRLGTQGDNLSDARRKGRSYPPPIRRGVHNGFARLVRADVLEIRALCEEGVPQKTIARHFGISQTHVSDIHTRKAWGWL